jgi:hypothetical protein
MLLYFHARNAATRYFHKITWTDTQNGSGDHGAQQPLAPLIRAKLCNQRAWYWVGMYSYSI